jgi:ketosteroid isomerase-like protein
MIFIKVVRRPAIAYWLVLAFFFVGCAPAWGGPRQGSESKAQADTQARNNTAEGEQIKRQIARYAESIDKADAALASTIWSNTSEVSFIHPLGHEHGFEQIKKNVIEGLMGGLFSERKLSFHDISVHVYGDAAWAEFYWDFAAKMRKDGTLFNSQGRETQIYHREMGEWRLVHVHYSGMPVTGEGRGL